MYLIGTSIELYLSSSRQKMNKTCYACCGNQTLTETALSYQGTIDKELCRLNLIKKDTIVVNTNVFHSDARTSGAL